MQFFFLIFVALFLIDPMRTADVTCPKSPINSKTPTGAFPATGVAPFPMNYECAIEFDIPGGQIVKFTSQSNTIFGNGDAITIMDSASNMYEMSSGEALLYVPANYSKVWIRTKTDTASFYISWQYIDVMGFSKVWSATGTVMALNLSMDLYYQFTSQNSRVVFNVATLDRTDDISLNNIYVYNGEDLKARYIGTLMDLIVKPGVAELTGKSIILVNYYGSDSRSWGIANDYSAISQYNSYMFYVLSQGIDYSGFTAVPDGKQSAVTFYCVDSKETYITDIEIKDRKNGRQLVEFIPLTPTHKFTQLLSYNVNTPVPQMLPQQILSNTFTVVMYQCDLHWALTSGPSYIWTLAVPGRQGWLYSPSMWNPLTLDTDPYLTNFTSTEMVKFVFNLQSVVINKPGENIHIEFGSSGAKPVFVEFNTTAIDTGEKAAYGTYMSTSFTGKTALSTFIMSFSVEGNVTSTTVPVETTTKSSALNFNLTVFIFIFGMLF